MLTRDREKELISRVIGGDKDGFEELVLENQKIVYNIALRMLNNEEDAVDISQEAFLRAYRALPLFRGDSSFSSWIYRLTSNLCIDFIRKQKKHRLLSLSYTDPDGEETETDIPDLRNEPQGELERHEFNAAVKTALGRLSPEHRQVMILRDLTGLSYNEIADIAGVELGTVKSRIARSRMQMRRLLMEGNIFAEDASDIAKGGDLHERL